MKDSTNKGMVVLFRSPFRMVTIRLERIALLLLTVALLALAIAFKCEQKQLAVLQQKAAAFTKQVEQERAARIQAENERADLEFAHGDITPIAAINPSDAAAISELLDRYNIRSIIGGSAVYGVSVKVKNKRKAIQILRSEWEAKGHTIWFSAICDKWG